MKCRLLKQSRSLGLPMRVTTALRALWLNAVIVLGCGTIDAQPPTAPVQGTEPTSVKLDVIAPRGVVVWERTDGGEDRVICASPCRTTVRTDAVLETRIVDLPDPPRFNVPRYSEDAILYVETPRVFLPGAAAVAGVSGGGAMIAGAVAMIGDVNDVKSLDGALVPGAITVVVGAGGVALAIVFAVLAQSKVVLMEKSKLALEF